MDSPATATGPTLRQSRKHAAILAAAAEVFLEIGYDNGSMDAVAGRAKVSKQTVYAHFGTKEALFLAMAQHLTDGAVAAHRDRVDSLLAATRPEIGLTAYGRDMLDIVVSPHLMALRRLATAEAQRFPEFGATVFRTGPGNSIARLSEAIARWHAAGELDAPDPDRAGALFNWMLMGGPTSEAMLLGQAAFGPGGAEAHVAECVRVFLAGYRRQAAIATPARPSSIRRQSRR